MGSFIAASVADTRPVRGLVLQSRATNPDEWMRTFFRPTRFKWWPRPAFPFHRFSADSVLSREDNQARVRRPRAPLLLLVGSEDEVTVPGMSRALFRASSTPDSLKWLVELSGSDHEDVLRNPEFVDA